MFKRVLHQETVGTLVCPPLDGDGPLLNEHPKAIEGGPSRLLGTREELCLGRVEDDIAGDDVCEALFECDIDDSPLIEETDGGGLCWRSH